LERPSNQDYLESKRHATAHRRAKHRVNRVPVISQHGDVSLRQKIAQIDDGLHVAGENPVPEWVAEKIDLDNDQFDPPMR
jgi:hypothetical protein